MNNAQGYVLTVSEHHFLLPQLSSMVVVALDFGQVVALTETVASIVVVVSVVLVIAHRFLHIG